MVDTPWSLQLLMSVCELVYIGPVTLPGDANYTLLSHAALSSCAVVASAAVAAHVQLAQELNNAAVHAAEDTAHAVRGLGATRYACCCDPMCPCLLCSYACFPHVVWLRCNPVLSNRATCFEQTS